MLTFAIVACLLPCLLAYACFSDLFEMRLSNKLCAAIALAYPVFAVAAGLSLADFGLHMLAGLIVLVVTFGMFAAGWIGGGDAKFVAAVSIWMGFGLLAEYLAISAVLGGLLTFALLGMRRHPMPQWLYRLPWVQTLHSPKTGVPYGIALGVAALLMLPQAAAWQTLI
jgi:prepilin peptidase CpaA